MDIIQGIYARLRSNFPSKKKISTQTEIAPVDSPTSDIDIAQSWLNWANAVIVALSNNKQEEANNLLEAGRLGINHFFWEFYEICLPNPSMLKFFIENYAVDGQRLNEVAEQDIDIKNNSIQFTKAVLSGDRALISRLLEGQKIVLLKEHYCAIYGACLQGIKMLQLVLADSLSIDVNAALPDEEGDRLIHFILRAPRAILSDAKEILSLLLEKYPINMRVSGRLGQNALHILARDKAKLDLLEMVLPQLGTDLINSKDAHQHTPLMISIINDNLGALKLLCTYGADTEILGCSEMLVNQSGAQMPCTALSIAIYANRVQMVPVLLERGAKIDSTLIAFITNNAYIHSLLLEREKELANIQQTSRCKL
jgi:ankyrin repeat protein